MLILTLNITFSTLSLFHFEHTELRLAQDGEVDLVIDGGGLDVEDGRGEPQLLQHPPGRQLRHGHRGVALARAAAVGHQHPALLLARHQQTRAQKRPDMQISQYRCRN